MWLLAARSWFGLVTFGTLPSRSMRDRPATIRDIARELGLCYSTVSRALSADPEASRRVAEETRRRVRHKAEEMRYRPNVLAQGMATGRTGTMGVLTYRNHWEAPWRQVEQILRTVEGRGYQALIALSRRRRSMSSLHEHARQISQLLSRGIDGLLIEASGWEGEAESIRDAVGDRAPVVTFGHPLQGLSGVAVDESAGFFKATEHLIRLGHRRIGFIGTDWSRSITGSSKGRGYLRAMRTHGLHPRRIPRKSFPAKPSQDLSHELAAEFTALLCRCDPTAMGVCRGLGEAGLRVPEDLAVVGRGNSGTGALLTPALTSLATPFGAVAEAAMELMAEPQGQRPPRHVVVAPHLVVRESCGAKGGGSP